MSSRAQIAMLPDGRRLHLQDGPIDLIVEAFGENEAIRRAYAAAAARFGTILDELCTELTLLRAPAAPGSAAANGAVARRMQEAVAPFAAEMFITPMAAVAGAVAEEVLAAMMLQSASLSRAYVNNGGDIALHLAPGTAFLVGLVNRPDRPSMFGTARLRAEQGIRGIATSGWRGRSFSLGIADAVTVLADAAAKADAAATVIANAVDLPGHPGIERIPACDLQPDSDLGERAVTRYVPVLDSTEIGQALAAGLARAEELRSRGLIGAAALHLQGRTAIANSEALAGPADRRLAHG